MSTPSSVMPQPPVEPQVKTPVVISATRLMYWSVRRELWENRSVYLAPLAAAALFLLGFMISAVRLPEKMRAALALDPTQQHGAIAAVMGQPYSFAAFLIMGTTFLVAIFYSLDALHGERRDRSILFWKSLPVSDLTTVLAKASIPIVVIPLLTVAITVVTQLLMLLLTAAVLLASGLSVNSLWSHLPLFEMWLMLLYHMVAVHALWYAPMFAWLLLVSAWARRTPVLWAAIPPFAIFLVEKIVFRTSYFATMLGSRMSGGETGDMFQTGSMSMSRMSHLTPGSFVSAPGLWIGLVFAGAFIAKAARLRRNREPV